MRDRLAHLLIYFNEPLPDHFAVLARLRAEVADETAVSPADPVEILGLCIDEGAQALKGRKRAIAKSSLNHRAGVLEIEIEYFKAESFFGSEVVGERPLRHLRRLNYVADARAREPALVHDAKALSQYFFAVRRLTHECNMYVRIKNVKKPWTRLLPLMPSLGPRFGAQRPLNCGGRLARNAAIPSCVSALRAISAINSF